MCGVNTHAAHSLPVTPYLNLTRRQCEGQNQVPSAPASLAAARRHRDELLAVDHVHRRRRKDPRPGIELPQLLAGFGVKRVEISGEVAACADEDQTAGGDH